MTEQDIRNLILDDSEMMNVLKAVKDLRLPDCWIGAGFVRNKVWNYLHQYPNDLNSSDIDVVYYNDRNTDSEQEKAIENALAQKISSDWSVTNQARMHTENGDEQYTSTEDAISYWPETATAVAVRLGQSHELEIIAPYGLDDLLSMIIRMSPKFKDPNKFKQRLSSKRWQERWPQVTIIN
ncbi:nucleotidyltransferase family protein [bacterium]|nr:MAG: nucleotidyltransferase family protein [bacterium]